MTTHDMAKRAGAGKWRDGPDINRYRTWLRTYQSGGYSLELRVVEVQAKVMSSRVQPLEGGEEDSVFTQAIYSVELFCGEDGVLSRMVTLDLQAIDTPEVACSVAPRRAKEFMDGCLAAFGSEE